MWRLSKSKVSTFGAEAKPRGMRAGLEVRRVRPAQPGPDCPSPRWKAFEQIGLSFFFPSS